MNFKDQFIQEKNKIILENYIKFQNKWEYDSLSHNPNFIFDIIKYDPDKPYNYSNISEHQNITWDHIKTYSNLKWNWYNILNNPNITREIIEANLSLFENNCINIHDVKKPLDNNYLNIIENDNLTLWYKLSCHEDLNIDILNRFKNKNLSWYIISSNKNFSWDDICQNNLPWDIQGLCNNPNVKWKHFITIPNYKMYIPFYSKNINITFDIVKNNLNLNWSWRHLSMHPNITWKNIEENLHLPWQTKYIWKNPNINWKIIQNINNIYKDYNLISYNPNITHEIVESNNLPWSWKGLSKNPNMLFSDEDAINVIKKITSCQKIKTQWKRSVSDPGFVVCQNRLLYEFNQLI